MSKKLHGLTTVALVTSLSACAYHAHSTQANLPSRAQLDQLWDSSAAIERRDLFVGPGGRALAPRNPAQFTFVEKDTSGASPGYKVRDATGLEWDVKLGPEAPVEVVVSRLVWAVGFHQPPTYYLPQWTLNGGPNPGTQAAGRFRPLLRNWHRTGHWAWHENPFVGTRELRGLFVLMVVLNNWDLKTAQNAVYDVRQRGQTEHRYVIQDLGASLGGTRWFFPGSKGDVNDYEHEPFIRGIRDGVVQFHYRGAWRQPHLDDDITVDDVLWTCRLLNRLSDRQLTDAFRAGGYDASVAARYTEHLRERVREGLSVAAASARKLE